MTTQARGTPVVLAVTGGGLLTACLGLFSIGNGDVWWHIALGALAARGTPVPPVDPYTYASRGPHNYVEPLGDLAFFAADRAAGVAGIMALKLALLALMGVLVARLAMRGLNQDAPPLPAALVVLATTTLVAAASMTRFLARPLLFSQVLVAVLFLLLLNVDTRRPRALLLVPLLVLVWTEAHRGAIVAVGFLIACAAGLAVRRHTRAHAAMALVAAALSALAIATNPSGWYALTSPFTVLFTDFPDLVAIQEWAPLTPNMLLHEVPAFGILLVAWAVSRALTRRTIDVELCIVLAALVLATRVRFIAYAAIAMAPGVARGLQHAATAIEARKPRVRTSIVATSVLVLSLCIAAWTYTTNIVPSERHLGVAGWIPVDVARFLKASPPPGRMYNDRDFGGYLIYALGPEQKVFVDARTASTLYSTDHIIAAFTTPGSADAMRTQVGRWDITWAVTPHASPTDGRYRYLDGELGWRLVYWDDVAAVHVRPTDGTAAYLEAHAYTELRTSDAYRRVASIATDPKRTQLVAELERNVDEVPDSLRARWLLCLALRALKDPRFPAAALELRSRSRARGIDSPL